MDPGPSNSLLHQAPAERSRQVVRLALEAGFDDAGVASVGPHPEAVLFSEWLEQGFHGDMVWLERHRRRRMEPDRLMAGARSVIAVALDYDTDAPRSVDVAGDPERGWISRYAWGTDYHRLMDEALRGLCERLGAAAPGAEFRHWVDHGPVLEKVYARRAGLGWMGKHTNLIHPERGSFFFLGVVFTDLELQPDTPIEDRCGTCTACLDACPTGAFAAPFVLDARRCISYLTIEARHPPSADLPPGLGGHVFGCDVCQDVCPWNRKPIPPDRPEFRPRPGLLRPLLRDIEGLSEADFASRFEGSAVARRGRDALAGAARRARAAARAEVP